MFKPGDIVKFVGVARYSYIKLNETATVISIEGSYMKLSCWDLGHGYHSSKFELVPEWTPTNGELVLAWGPCAQKDPRTFIGMNKGKYICQDRDSSKSNAYGFYYSFESVEQIPQTHTVTVDGKDIVLSAESFKAFKDQFTKD